MATQQELEAEALKKYDNLPKEQAVAKAKQDILDEMRYESERAFNRLFPVLKHNIER